MKFYVTTVLPRQTEHVIVGDVLYVEDCRVKIAGVEHNLRYGDIVQHGDHSYYMNEETLSTDDFDNAFTDTWYLTSGEIPKDGKRYLLIVPEGIPYAYDLSAYTDKHEQILSRDVDGITVHEMTSNKMFNWKDQYAYVDGTRCCESETAFYEAVDAYNNRHVDTIVETVIQKQLRVPEDGKPGERASL